MANTTITIYPQYVSNQVTSINCGTSSPRLSGTIDISAFSNLTSFICNSNSITSLSGYENNTNLQTLQFFDNKVSGTFPSLSGMQGLISLLCHQNQFTGSIPSLSGLNNLRILFCFSNQLTGNIPELNSLPNFLTLHCSSNLLTGNIPSLSGATSLINFYCNNNQLTGIIPYLGNNNNLQNFFCGSNQLSGFSGGSVSITLGNFEAQNNQLTSSTVNSILAAFVAANKISGTRILNLGGSGNAAPTGQGLTDKSTLISRGWTVTTN